jgi:hypothetical protein
VASGAGHADCPKGSHRMAVGMDLGMIGS